MAKFKFYEDRQITAWRRDYYEVEAETLEDAIELIKSNDMSLEELEYTKRGADWLYHDGDVIWDTMEDTDKFGIYSCDLELEGEESEIIAK